MRRGGPGAARAAPALLAWLAVAAPVAPACELHLDDARRGTKLAQLPLDPKAPEVRIAFEHSVLGTTVVDRYRFTPRPHLVEEEFEGEGYGLPATAGPGEQLLTLPPQAPGGAPGLVSRGGPRQRLTLNRPVDPLVVRLQAGPRMRLLHPGGELPLASLGASTVAISAHGCAAGHLAPTP